VSYGIREVAARANVPEEFARRLVAVGALPAGAGLGPPEVRRVRLLHSWAAAGLSVEAIVALVDRGAWRRRWRARAAGAGAAAAGDLFRRPGRLHPAHRGARGRRRRARRRRLTRLENEISRDRGGRPVRWLGDGGMFHFREPRTAVVAGLDMVEQAPAADLPPAHVGIHTGPVISQDGDVYGRTVNVAARTAAYARAGQVVVSEETAHRSAGDGLRFRPLGTVGLKGVARPLPLYQALRG
jgi:class 3 adenylate cyclase